MSKLNSSPSYEKLQDAEQGDARSDSDVHPVAQSTNSSSIEHHGDVISQEDIQIDNSQKHLHDSIGHSSRHRLLGPLNSEVVFVEPDKGTPAAKALEGKCSYCKISLDTNLSISLQPMLPSRFQRYRKV